MSTIPIDDKLVIGPDRANIDARYKASNNRPYTSVAAAEAAINLVIGNVGLTVLVADGNDPDYPKAKEYWVQPKGTTPETYGLVEKGAGTTDYADLDNKPTISDGGQGSAQIPLSGNVKVTAKAATSVQTTGVTVTAENGGITMAFTLEKGTDGVNGKSAYQQWLDEGNTGDETDFLNSLKAHIAGFKSVSYDENAPTTIGDTASTIGSFSPSANTMDKIVLMPNSDGTATIMYTTTATESEGTTTYAFSCIGELAIDTSNFLSSSSVDSTNLKNPTSSQVAKAEDVMRLAAKLEGVTAVEDKVLLGEEQDKAINGNNGELCTDSWGGHFVVNLISGVKKVRFRATEVSNQSTYPYGYCFYSDNEGTIAIKSELYRLKTGSNNQPYDLVVEVPDNAVVFKFSVGSASRNSVYCYLQSGESVQDKIDKLYGRVDESVKSDTNYASSIASGNIALNIDTTGLTRGGDTARCGDVLIDNIGNYAKLRIKGYSSRSSRLIFVKKDVRSLPSGTYDFQYLKDEYLCEEATADSYVVTIPSLTSTPEGVVVNIPQDATRVVIQCKRTDGFDNYPSSVVPFGVAVKGDIETMIDEKLEDFTPVTVEDTLESDSTEDALSANQGRVLAGQLTKMREVIVFKLMTYAIATSGNVWGTDIEYAHAMVPVKEGEKYRLYNRGTSNNIRYALLTSDECTAGGVMPLVDGTQVDTVNGGSYHDIVIPSGCRYLTFMEDKPGYSSYYPKLYRVLTLADKEFYEDDMEFGVTLPVDALAYHEGWNELVDAGIVTRSNPTYMNWDSEQEYPLYTYRIKRHTDWMKSSYAPQDSTATPTDTVKIVDELHLDEGQPTTYSPADDVPNPNYYRRKIMVTCGVHGSERLTPNTFLKWVKKHINDDIFAEFDFVIIPLCNPWGYSHSLLYNGSQSYNRMTYTNPTSDSAYTIVKNTVENGYYYGIRRTTTNTDNNHLVDINRDFLDDDEGATANGEATKFVTQEAQYIRDIYIAERPDMVIDFHQDLNSTDNGVGFDEKCGFVSFGASNVQAIKDKLIECRRKSYTQTNKACYMTDNKYSVGREQYSYTWGERYPNSESSWETVHQSTWKNYASGGSGNALHKDCAVRYSFTFETDVYCRKLNGTNSPNNRVAKQYGYEFMTKFLKYIFGVWDMGDCERHVYTISNT